ncbi:MAG: endolytic transglycosylase MltG [Candidatus Neomarinimicrobiota bacterium]|nr:endolytic transglycosylase MltG [Candidatus Neomarinimicrobiota bacterium]
MFKKIPFYFQNNFTEFIAISVLSGMMFYYSIVLLWPQPGINQETNISIPKGSSLVDVAAELVEKRVINNKLSFVLAVKILGYEKDLPAGKFKIVNAGTNYALIKQLLNSVGLSKKVTILEGWTIEDIAEKVSNSLKIDKNEFIDASTDIALLKKWDIENNSFEGYLFPDTYQFDEDQDAIGVINTMVSEYKKNFTSQMRERMDEINLTENEVLALASIIEGEAIYDSERPRISGVYHNRLKKGMRLQADPTIQYIIEDSPRRLLNKDLKIKSPYNTYLNYGLPPGPINSPGLESIKAALYPEKVDFLFFVAKGDGYHTFSRTEKEHNKAKRSFQKVRRKNKLKKKADKS